MTTCKGCKYFEPAPADNSGRSVPPYGYCVRWNTGYNYDDSKMPLNECLVEDDEGWGAIVGPDFGCVLWEQRP